MTTPTKPPNLFTVTFWQVAAGQVIVGIASGLLGPLVAAGTAAAADTHFSVPWWSLAASALTGGLTALCHAIIGQQIPGTGVASLLPIPKAVRDK